MGSKLTECLNILNQVLIAPDGTFPLNRDHQTIQNYLHLCKTPQWISQWHRVNVNWVQNESGSLELDTLCENAGTALLASARRASYLRKWADREIILEHATARDILRHALGDVIKAFKAFEIVARKPEAMAARHIMDMVRVYLCQVYDLAMILGTLAVAHGWFQYCAELRQDSNLEGFIFDTADFYPKSIVDDRTIRGVLSQVDRVPETCLPADPQPPALGVIRGGYETLVLRNFDWMERGEPF